VTTAWLRLCPYIDADAFKQYVNTAIPDVLRLNTGSSKHDVTKEY
jgi:hypothetical protein